AGHGTPPRGWLLKRVGYRARPCHMPHAAGLDPVSAVLIGRSYGTCKRAGGHDRSARGGTFRPDGGRLVGSEGIVGGAPPDEPGAPALHPRTDRPALERRRA